MTIDEITYTLNNLSIYLRNCYTDETAKKKTPSKEMSAFHQGMAYAYDDTSMIVENLLKSIRKGEANE